MRLGGEDEDEEEEVSLAIAERRPNVVLLGLFLMRED